ncbi:MAG: methyltransferase domain-containing protein [Acetobacteraceae bacterium]|nr:methyltransferase domain-containing protein [Acetobacteraceae bacterium]
MSGNRLDAARRGYARAMVAPLGVPAPALEAAFATVPREAFMPPGPWILLHSPGGREVLAHNDPMALYPQAAEPELLVVLDAARGINNGSPSLHALMLHALAVRPGDRVLHLGAGTGYYSAILAELVGPAGQVTAVEFVDHLAEQARRNLAPWPWATLVQGDAADFPAGEVDRIYVNFAVADPPPSWFTRLRAGGTAVLPLGTGGGAVLRVERLAAGFAARFVTPCGFIGAAGRLAGDAAHRARLDAAFARGGTEAVRSLHLAPSRPAEAWFRADNWALSPAAPG